MNCIAKVSEWPIIFILPEHQAVPGRKLPLMPFFYDLHEGYLINCAMRNLMWFWPCSCCLQTGNTILSSTPYRQLENQAPNTTGSNYLYNTLELLMMGIMVPETCWASNKICNKNSFVASSWHFISKCAMIILNSKSKSFRLAAVRAHTAYKWPCNASSDDRNVNARSGSKTAKASRWEFHEWRSC